jgi:glycogen debranching enzyme
VRQIYICYSHMTDLAPIEATLANQGRVAEERAPNRLFALKDGDSFVVADAYGDIIGEADGFVRHDTRLLSEFRLTLAGARPALLSAAISRDNVVFTSHLTNRPLRAVEGQVVPQGVIHIERTRVLCAERLYERVTCVNYGESDTVALLGIGFAADFHDIFELRGEVREKRGSLRAAELAGERVVLRYDGLDHVLRSTTISFSLPPARLTSDRAEFRLLLKARGSAELYIEVGAGGGAGATRARFRQAAAQARRAMRQRSRRGARLRSPDHLFNTWVDQSRSDVALLTTELPTGPYPYAGIPWFSTPFGRDAIITALQMLWLDSTLARGVLTYLAKYQAQETSSFRDSAPGKIMHETRKGEMTALDELPFARYYGGVDTTPLFVVLAGAYAERTGDLAFIDELWPSLEAAVAWIGGAANSSPDDFLVYARGADSGLANQGWKDSENAIFHEDGRFPRGPIALVEVQGYVFAALNAMADLAERRGKADAAARWRSRADALRHAVEQRFWMDNKGFYGIALDGEGQLARVCASNVGHLLFTGLSGRERAARVARRFLSAEFDTGWGIRTLAPDQPHFNPMSYHNGSVWPHDTAICAAGLARYGERDGVVHLTREIFEAAATHDMRLPELFCGFVRKPGEKPVSYPVACLPQAWAAGSVFMLIQACLGLRIDGWNGRIHLDEPALPAGLERLSINDLAVGPHRIDLTLQRRNGRVVVTAAGPHSADVPIVVRQSAASSTRPS